MRKMKNILCMVLALAMVFALAIPAFAAADGAENGGVQPLAYTCTCGGLLAFSKTVSTTYEGGTMQQNGCSNLSYAHYHYTRVVVNAYVCNSCGKTTNITTKTYNYCQY